MDQSQSARRYFLGHATAILVLVSVGCGGGANSPAVTQTPSEKTIKSEANRLVEEYETASERGGEDLKFFIELLPENYGHVARIEGEMSTDAKLVVEEFQKVAGDARSPTADELRSSIDVIRKTAESL